MVHSSTAHLTNTSNTPNTITPPSTTTLPTTMVHSSTTAHLTNSSNTPNTTTPPTSITTVLYITSPITIPPLVCVNGGELQNGVCICPDEWTGKTCSNGNFCNSTNVGNFTFPRTVIGWFGYSAELCTANTNTAGISKAAVRCLNDTGSPRFGPPQILKCGLTLIDIQRNISMVSGDLLHLASSTQILTSRPEHLSADNITRAVQIANMLFQSNITQEIFVAAVTTISQLLNTSEKGTHESDAVKSLTVTLEQLSKSSNMSLVVQPNLLVQSAQVPGDTVGVHFTAFTGGSGNFVANRIKLNTDSSELISDNGGSTDIEMVIKFKPVLRSENTNHSIGFVLYQNDNFFRSKAFQASLGTSRRVLSANLGETSGLDVEMLFKPMAVTNASLYDFACVSWDYTLDDWSTYGCSKVNNSEDTLQCFCNHTTNFAVLMVYRRDFTYAEAHNWITILGCSMSIIGLSLTIIFQIVTRKSRENILTLLIVSICTSLLIFTLLFMLGVENPNQLLEKPKIQINTIPSSDIYTKPDKGPCTAVAVLLQYFLLGTFTWSTLCATNIFVMIKHVRVPKHLTAYTMIIGWGLPAVVVGLTLGISYRVDNPLGYRQEEFCWLAAFDPKGNFDFTLPMFWGLLVPVVFILIFNTALLMCFSNATDKINIHVTSIRHDLTKTFYGSFSIVVVFGLSWILGYLLLITHDQTAYTILNIFFCILTTTQGLQIFLLFTARSAFAKKNMSSALKSLPSFHIPLYHTMKYSFNQGNQNVQVESYKQLNSDL
ncbi:hypothetical protein UPYG_G00022110 [Umbra pygmaea]|uniref:Adhesion G-protein coupled receptor G7-like n=1 Tax=Umbra pygmaea TaxID=75934 RepID=A0ABD0XKZ7_UMBPY